MMWQIRVHEKCQKNKMTQCHTRMPLVITDTPSTAFEKYSIDIIGQFCPSRSHHYTLTVQDLSKFLIAVPLEDRTAEQVAKVLVDHVAPIIGYRKLFYPIVEASF